MIKVSFYT